MYYSVFDPYNEHDDTCLICWDSDSMVVHFHSIYNKCRMCSCTGYFHIPCIETWVRKNKTCPICRTRFYHDESINRNNNTVYSYRLLTYILAQFHYKNDLVKSKHELLITKVIFVVKMFLFTFLVLHSIKVVHKIG